jgi:lipopolysaccharide biosynthesis protein
LRADCCDVLLRENSGLDFASWSAGFAKHAPMMGARLLLANDSVYGPIGDLRHGLERLTCRPADFYGMVESVEIAPHLQSWLPPRTMGGHIPGFQFDFDAAISSMTKRQIVR